MANEGEFPKNDGDFIYASEVNRCAGAGRFLGAGSTIWITSGTAYQDMGSIVVGAGSVTNPGIVTLDFRTSNVPDVFGLHIILSGATANGAIGIHSGAGMTNEPFHTHFKALVGSPLSGCIIAQSFGTALWDNTTQTSSSNDLKNFDLSQQFVILIRGVTTGSVAISHYNAQAFRGSL